MLSLLGEVSVKRSALGGMIAFGVAASALLTLSIGSASDGVAADGGKEPVSNHKGGMIVRRAWLVQTDDFTDRLGSESFWRRGGSGGSSRSYNRDNSRASRMSLGRFFKDRGDDYDNDNTHSDEQYDQGEGSEFYTGDGDTYRTVCVRACDGYFSPVSFSTTEDRFERDQEICESRCGGGKLYVYKNPGETPEDMVDLDGKAYKKLKTAFLFKTTYVAACTCKPQPWQQASRDKHKLYALKAAVKKSRGKKKRRMARAAVRKFKRIMRRRGRTASLKMSVAGMTRTDAMSAAVAGNRRGSHILSAAEIEKLEQRRVASFSPVRSLPTQILPSETEQSVAMEGVARVVTPENDDDDIFLPVRNPVRVLSMLSRPSGNGGAAAVVLHKAELETPAAPVNAGTAEVTKLAAARTAPSDADDDWVEVANADESILLPTRNPVRQLAGLLPGAGLVDAARASVRDEAITLRRVGRRTGHWVVAENDDTEIMLPSRNPLKRAAKLTAVKHSRVRLNASVVAVLAASEKAKQTGTSGPGSRRQQANLMRLGAKSARRRIPAALVRRQPRRASADTSPRPSRAKHDWRRVVFESGD